MKKQDQGQGNQGKDCSFCGKNQNEVKKLIAGPTVTICNECVGLCNTILDEKKIKAMDGKGELPSPKRIAAFLDEYVIGQDRAKRVMSVAVHNHYKRLLHGGNGVDIDKSNILLVGPTGTGKTLLAKSLARILDVPFAIADATTLTESGYVGEDVESVISKLLMAADYDVERAQKGIIYIDEIDKIGRKADSPSITRDVSGEGVQQALLKLIEGTEAMVTARGGRKNPMQETIAVDTSNILFICGGAFAGLDKVVAERQHTKSIGFGATVADADQKGDLKDVKTKDLVKFGLIPEFIGRLPVVASLEALDEGALIRVLTEPKNAITRQFHRLFEIDGVGLEFEPDALTEIAKAAISRETGARGLRSIVEEMLLETMFELPDLKGVEKVRIDRDVAIGAKPPIHVAANDQLPEAA